MDEVTCCFDKDSILAVFPSSDDGMGRTNYTLLYAVPGNHPPATLEITEAAARKVLAKIAPTPAAGQS